MTCQCNCGELEDIVNCGDNEQEEFIQPKGLHLVRRRRDAGLFVCPECSVHWQVDLGLRGPQAIKVVEPSAWDRFDDVPFRLAYLERFNGEVGEQTCLFRGCSEFALKGIVFCVRHAHPSVAEPGREPGSLGK
jgi:hypothetical protein